MNLKSISCVNTIQTPLYFILLLMTTINVVKTEVFTALAEMEELLETEAVLITNLQGYIDVQEKKLDYLKK